MWYQHILERLGPLKPHPAKTGFWQGRCPAHDDRRPSMTVWLGRNDCLLVRCFAGCDWKEILAHVGLKVNEMFKPDEEGPYGKNRGVVRQEEVKRHVIETYDYTDESGKLLFQVCRYEPKGFAFRQSDPEHKRSRDGWIWEIGRPEDGGPRRVLYRLERLAKARREQPIFVVEGERKVHALEALGFLATCNSGGANMNQSNGWREEYNDSLRGRRVVILPDNDRKGKQHALYIAGNLIAAPVAGLRIVELPGLPEKGDILDWLAAGGNRQGLIDCIKGVAEWGTCPAKSAAAA